MINYSERFFALLAEYLDPKLKIADVVADVLDISKDAAYRRLRGETDLGLAEALQLSHHAGFSLSALEASHQGTVRFSRGNFIKSFEDYETYLSQSLKQLERIARVENHKLYYLAKDIPIFYQFAFPNLAAFKMYVWLKSLYLLPQVENRYLSLTSIPPRLVELAQKQWQVYSQINAIEIWNDTTVDSLLSQLEYYFEAGLLESKEQAEQIIEEFREMMKLIYRQSLSGHKAHPKQLKLSAKASYQLYYHELLIMDNHLLLKMGEQGADQYFIPYGGLNYLSTVDKPIIADLEQYLDNQLKSAYLISEISEKERNQFFIRIKNRIGKLKDKIEMLDPFM